MKSLIHRLNTQIHLSLAKTLPWGDMVGLSLQGNYHLRKPDDLYSKKLTVYENSTDKDLRDYYMNNKRHGYEYQSSLDYVFSLPRHWQITPRLSYGQTFHFQDNANYRLDWLEDTTYDKLGELPSNEILQTQAFDARNSYQYNDLNRTYMGVVSVDAGSNNSFFSMNFPLKVEKEHIHYLQSSLDTIAHRSNFSFEPNITYFKYGRNIRHFSYTMNVEKPDFNLLMPFANNTNPLALHINNPNLKSQIRHQIEANATFHADSTDLNYWININGNYVHHAWGTKTTYNTQTGAFTYMNDNVSRDNWDTSLRAGFHRSLDKSRHLSLEVSEDIHYIHSMDFDIAYDTESNSLSRVNTLNTGLDVKLKYRLRTFTIGAIGKSTGRFSRSNRKGFEKINAYDYQYGANLQYTLPVIQLTLTTDINMYSRRGYNSHQMNTDNLVWNALLSRPFAKGHIVAKLQAFDILHRLSTKSYAVNAQGRTETWYNALPRYLMCSIAFKFNQKNKKNNRRTSYHHGR